MLFDGDGNEGTTDDQVRLSAKVGGGYEYLLGIDFERDALDALGAGFECAFSVGSDCDLAEILPEVKAGFELTADGTVDVRLQGAAWESFETSEPLASVDISPPVYVVGPLVFVPSVDVVAKLSGGASSRLDVGVRALVEASTELSWSSKTGGNWQPPMARHEADVTRATVGLHATLRGQVEARLSVLLYGMLGPTASLGVFAELEADATAGPDSGACFEARAGATLGVGFVLGLKIPAGPLVEFGSVSADFDLFSVPVAARPCEAPSGTNSLPPGSGPDFERLAMPTFTPVSVVRTGLVAHHPPSVEDLQRLRMLRTIDGRLLLTGPHLQAAVKVTEQGDVVWARRYVDPAAPRMDGLPPDRVPLAPVAAAPTQDARLLVLTHPRGWMLVRQDGTVDAAHRVTAPAAGSFSFQGSHEHARRLVDALPIDDGHVVVGAMVPPSAAPDSGPVRALLVWLDETGAVRQATSYERPGHHLFPRQIHRLGAGLAMTAVEVGSTRTERRALLVRLSNEGEVLGATRFACMELDEQADQPQASLVSREGALVVALSVGDLYRGAIFTFSPDGTPRGSALLRPGSGVDELTPSGIVELPTSGYVLTGTYQVGFEPPEQLTASLDASGRLQWLSGARLESDMGEIRDAGRGDLVATDDGGLFVASTSVGRNATAPDRLWLTKAFARDGTVSFRDGTATRFASRMYVNAPCTPRIESVPVMRHAVSVETASFTPVVEPVSSTTERISP
ncbi:MAG: hypothetical protein RMK74_04485 [Myxococcales bacterium]|nr:hypothetical protein [Myxococcales bacterium]